MGNIVYTITNKSQLYFQVIILITFFASLLGFAGSAVPELLELFKERSDRKHQLTLLNLQSKLQKEGKVIDATITESKQLYDHASQPSGYKWLDALRSSVRPVLTYGFFLLFCFIKAYALIDILGGGFTVPQGLVMIWDEETQILFSAIISFWFGQRAFARIIKK